MTAPTMDGGAIQANRRQLTRPARMWAIDAVSAATALMTRFAPVPAAALEAKSSVAGSRRLPNTRPTSPPAAATAKHHRTKARYSMRDGGPALRHRGRRQDGAHGSARGRRAPGRPHAPTHADRAGRPGAYPRPRVGPAARRRGGPTAFDDLLRAARVGQDDARAHRGLGRLRRLRGAECRRGRQAGAA